MYHVPTVSSVCHVTQLFIPTIGILPVTNCVIYYLSWPYFMMKCVSFPVISSILLQLRMDGEFFLGLEEEGGSEGDSSWGHMLRTMGLSTCAIPSPPLPPHSRSSNRGLPTFLSIATAPSPSPLCLLRASLLPFRARYHHRRACLQRGNYSGAQALSGSPSSQWGWGLELDAGYMRTQLEVECVAAGTRSVSISVSVSAPATETVTETETVAVVADPAVNGDDQELLMQLGGADSQQQQQSPREVAGYAMMFSQPGGDKQAQLETESESDNRFLCSWKMFGRLSLPQHPFPTSQQSSLPSESPAHLEQTAIPLRVVSGDEKDTTDDGIGGELNPAGLSHTHTDSWELLHQVDKWSIMNKYGCAYFDTSQSAPTSFHKSLHNEFKVIFSVCNQSQHTGGNLTDSQINLHVHMYSSCL